MRRLFTWPIVSFYSLCVIIVSVLPIKTPEQAPGPFFDKYTHIIMYFVLAWLFINTLARRNVKYPHIICFCYAFFLGASLECVQYFLSYRSFEFADMLANALGAVIGMFIRMRY